jgi:hypothetical protein
LPRRTAAGARRRRAAQEGDELRHVLLEIGEGIVIAAAPAASTASCVRAAKIRRASSSGTPSSSAPCTSRTGQRTRASVLTGAMSSKRWPMVRCT